MFKWGYSFAGLVLIKSWLECWKPVESLLEQLEFEKWLQQTNYWPVLSLSVWDSYDNLFKSPSRNYWKFISPWKEWSRLDQSNFQLWSTDADASLFSLLLAFYYTINRSQLAVKWFSCELQPISGAKSTAMIRMLANKRQRMFPWFQQTFVGGVRLRDKPKQCLRGRLIIHENILVWPSLHN